MFKNLSGFNNEVKSTNEAIEKLTEKITNHLEN